VEKTGIMAHFTVFRNNAHALHVSNTSSYTVLYSELAMAESSSAGTIATIVIVQVLLRQKLLSDCEVDFDEPELEAAQRFYIVSVCLVRRLCDLCHSSYMCIYHKFGIIIFV
jgi:hypothetical protein